METKKQNDNDFIADVSNITVLEKPTMVKSALFEAKKLLDFYIENTDDLDTEQIESVRHFIKALRAGCGCDDYNGFDCGCGKRAFLCDEALNELEGSTCH